ncbi:MAG: hypothetical protein ACKOOI_21375, partial [Pirellula sp.]
MTKTDETTNIRCLSELPSGARLSNDPFSLRTRHCRGFVNWRGKIFLNEFSFWTLITCLLATVEDVVWLKFRIMSKG